MLLRDKLVNWFCRNYPSHVLQMQRADHNHSLSTPNTFHAEGSVWTHTMMVMTWIQASNSNFPYMRILLAAALLHDLGKPASKDFKEATSTKPARFSFHGHEGYSTLMSIHIIKHIISDFDEFSESDLLPILQIISFHGINNDFEEIVLSMFLDLFRAADKFGAIRAVDEDIYSQYPNRRYASIKPNPDKHLVLLCGLPASGKSTIAEQYRSDGYTVISCDDARFAWYEATTGIKPDNYNFVYRYIHDNPEHSSSFDKYFDEIKSVARSTSNKICIDMTMLSLSSRRKTLNYFNNYTPTCEVLLTDFPTIQKRNFHRQETENKFISPYVYSSMMRSFILPTYQEGFTNINYHF